MEDSTEDLECMINRRKSINKEIIIQAKNIILYLHRIKEITNSINSILHNSNIRCCKKFSELKKLLEQYNPNIYHIIIHIKKINKIIHKNILYKYPCTIYLLDNLAYLVPNILSLHNNLLPETDYNDKFKSRLDLVYNDVNRFINDTNNFIIDLYDV